MVVQILTIKAVIHPANYDEQQLEQKREEIQTAEKVEEKMLPYGTRFGVFDNSGRWLYGTFTESEREEVWKAVLEEKNEISSGYLKRFQREEGICLVSYQLRVQFGNPALRERFSACSGITFAGSAFDFLCGSDVFDPIFQPED